MSLGKAFKGRLVGWMVGLLVDNNNTLEPIFQTETMKFSVRLKLYERYSLVIFQNKKAYTIPIKMLMLMLDSSNVKKVRFISCFGSFVILDRKLC